MKKYFPILLSKAGELTALSNLSQSVKESIVPVIQVLDDYFDKMEASFTTWDFDSNELFLDFSLCKNSDDLQIENLIYNLRSEGVNIVPVVDQNSKEGYKELLRSLLIRKILGSICVRFSNESWGFINVNERISSNLKYFNVDKGNLSILLDLGYVEEHNYKIIGTTAYNTAASLKDIDDFKNIIVASSSFMKDLSSLSQSNKMYTLPRYEWEIWKILQNQSNLVDHLKYGDYGTKHPFYDDAAAKFSPTCSIRYSLSDTFLVYKGQRPNNHPLGNAQYITFAKRIVNSHEYSGESFSWGDKRIKFYSEQSGDKIKPGNSTKWVEISQNHHITLMTSLL